MKQNLLLFVFTIIHFCAAGQEKVVKDLDNDQIKDTVYLDQEKSIIICRLSSQRFVKIASKPVEILNETSGIKETKNGFYFYNNWMRAGYSNQFRYNKTLKKIQLIGMGRYEFGGATNDGSGESSVNLLTNSYIGDWNYYSEKKEKLIKIPTIKTKMTLPKVFLENFSEEVYFDYADKCSELFGIEKEKLMKKE
ncbi:MAG: hypothetical protein ABI426_09180 [Flavobacterium sp.]